MVFERPIGRKVENANQKRKDDGKDVATEYLKKKMKILEEGCAAEKEKVRIKAENVRLQELKENERIMMLDTSGLTLLLCDLSNPNILAYIKCHVFSMFDFILL